MNFIATASFLNGDQYPVSPRAIRTTSKPARQVLQSAQMEHFLMVMLKLLDERAMPAA